jgi:hypothetical protein
METFDTLFIARHQVIILSLLVCHYIAFAGKSINFRVSNLDEVYIHSAHPTNRKTENDTVRTTANGIATKKEKKLLLYNPYPSVFNPCREPSDIIDDSKICYVFSDIDCETRKRTTSESIFKTHPTDIINYCDHPICLLDIPMNSSLPTTNEVTTSIYTSYSLPEKSTILDRMSEVYKAIDTILSLEEYDNIKAVDIVNGVIEFVPVGSQLGATQLIDDSKGYLKLSLYLVIEALLEVLRENLHLVVLVGYILHKVSTQSLNTVNINIKIIGLYLALSFLLIYRKHHETLHAIYSSSIIETILTSYLFLVDNDADKPKGNTFLRNQQRLLTYIKKMFNITNPEHIGLLLNLLTQYGINVPTDIRTLRELKDQDPSVFHIANNIGKKTKISGLTRFDYIRPFCDVTQISKNIRLAVGARTLPQIWLPFKQQEYFFAPKLTNWNQDTVNILESSVLKYDPRFFSATGIVRPSTDKDSNITTADINSLSINKAYLDVLLAYPISSTLIRPLYLSKQDTKHKIKSSAQIKNYIKALALLSLLYATAGDYPSGGYGTRVFRAIENVGDEYKYLAQADSPTIAGLLNISYYNDSCLVSVDNGTIPCGVRIYNTTVGAHNFASELFNNSTNHGTRLFGKAGITKTYSDFFSTVTTAANSADLGSKLDDYFTNEVIVEATISEYLTNINEDLSNYNMVGNALMNELLSRSDGNNTLTALKWNETKGTNLGEAVTKLHFITSNCLEVLFNTYTEGYESINVNYWNTNILRALHIEADGELDNLPLLNTKPFYKNIDAPNLPFSISKNDDNDGLYTATLYCDGIQSGEKQHLNIQISDDCKTHYTIENFKACSSPYKNNLEEIKHRWFTYFTGNYLTAHPYIGNTGATPVNDAVAINALKAIVDIDVLEFNDEISTALIKGAGSTKSNLEKFLRYAKTSPHNADQSSTADIVRYKCPNEEEVFYNGTAGTKLVMGLAKQKIIEFYQRYFCITNMILNFGNGTMQYDICCGIPTTADLYDQNTSKYNKVAKKNHTKVERNLYYNYGWTDKDTYPINSLPIPLYFIYVDLTESINHTEYQKSISTLYIEALSNIIYKSTEITKEKKINLLRYLPIAWHKITGKGWASSGLSIILQNLAYFEKGTVFDGSPSVSFVCKTGKTALKNDNWSGVNNSGASLDFKYGMPLHNTKNVDQISWERPKSLCVLHRCPGLIDSEHRINLYDSSAQATSIEGATEFDPKAIYETPDINGQPNTAVADKLVKGQQIRGQIVREYYKVLGDKPIFTLGMLDYIKTEDETKVNVPRYKQMIADIYLSTYNDSQYNNYDAFKSALDSEKYAPNYEVPNSHYYYRGDPNNIDDWYFESRVGLMMSNAIVLAGLLSYAQSHKSNNQVQNEYDKHFIPKKIDSITDSSETVTIFDNFIPLLQFVPQYLPDKNSMNKHFKHIDSYIVALTDKDSKYIGIKGMPKIEYKEGTKDDRVAIVTKDIHKKRDKLPDVTGNKVVVYIKYDDTSGTIKVVDSATADPSKNGVNIKDYKLPDANKICKEIAIANPSSDNECKKLIMAVESASTKIAIIYKLAEELAKKDIQKNDQIHPAYMYNLLNRIKWPREITESYELYYYSSDNEFIHSALAPFATKYPNACKYFNRLANILNQVWKDELLFMERKTTGRQPDVTIPKDSRETLPRPRQNQKDWLHKVALERKSRATARTGGGKFSIQYSDNFTKLNKYHFDSINQQLSFLSRIKLNSIINGNYIPVLNDNIDQFNGGMTQSNEDDDQIDQLLSDIDEEEIDFSSITDSEIDRLEKVLVMNGYKIHSLKPLPEIEVFKNAFKKLLEELELKKKISLDSSIKIKVQKVLETISIDYRKINVLGTLLTLLREILNKKKNLVITREIDTNYLENLIKTIQKTNVASDKNKENMFVSYAQLTEQLKDLKAELLAQRQQPKVPPQGQQPKVPPQGQQPKVPPQGPVFTPRVQIV